MKKCQGLFWGGLAAVGLGIGILHLARTHQGDPTPPFFSWPLAAGFLLLGLILLARACPEHVAPTWTFIRGPWVGVALAVVLLVAAAARLYRLDRVPPGLWLDETDIAKQALDIVRGARPKPWHVARLEIPWLYHYYVAGFYALLGPGYLTVKLPHVLISILTAGMLYLLARELLDEPYALFAALLWATMRWSINMSRWGHANAMALFWYVTVLWLLWRARQRSSWGYWLGAGVALGLSQYTYQAARSLVPLTLLLLLYWWVKDRPAGFGPRVGLLFLAFGLVYAPLAHTYIQQPRLFWERSKAISIFNPLFTRDPWAALRGNVGKYLGMFFYVGDPNGRHNIPGYPVVDPITAGLMVVGLARMLRARTRDRHVLLFLWLGTFLLAGILTTEAPNTFRVYGMTPALALVAALGLQELAEHIPRSRVLLPLLILPIAYWNLYTYFQVQAEHPAVVAMFNVGPTRVGQYITTLPEDAAIYLDRDFWAFSPIEVINPGRKLTRLKTPFHIPPPDASRPVVYILGNYGRLLLPYLRQLYPEAQVDVDYGPHHTFVYAGVRLSAAQVARRGLLTPAGHVVPVPPDAGEEGALHGGLVLPQPGVYGLRVEGVSAVRWQMGQTTVVDEPGRPVTVTLPGGLVPVQLSWNARPSARVRFLWRPPGQSTWEPVPADRWFPLDVPTGGLLAQWFEGGGLRTLPVTVTHAPLLFADNAGNLATSAMRWTGAIHIPRDGMYTFALSSDDGSRLWIDGELVVDNWGLHGAGWVEGQVHLQAGWHPLRLDYIDNGGSHWFEWQWAPPGEARGPVPARVLAWRPQDVQLALRPPSEPAPGIPVFDAGGRRIGWVPLAAARLSDPTFNRPIADANFQKWPMKLGDRMYERGIGVYGPGELEFHLGGAYRLLEGLVGVDRDTYGDAHTQVQIIGDGKVLWDSGEMHPWDPPRTFRVDVTGVRVLILRQIEEGHFEGRGDGVDWVDIRLRK